MPNLSDEEIKQIESQDGNDTADVAPVESHEEDGKNLTDQEKKA